MSIVLLNTAQLVLLVSQLSRYLPWPLVQSETISCERTAQERRQRVRMCGEERTADDVTLTVQAPES